MTRVVVLAALCAAAGCMRPLEPAPGLPESLMTADSGDLSGVWRPLRMRGPRYQLTIDQALGTFAVQHGCVATGGVLRPLGGGSYRLEHYTSGFAAAGCGPWRIDPSLAPFDARQVALSRTANRLTARAGPITVEFARVVRR